MGGQRIDHRGLALGQAAQRALAVALRLLRRAALGAVADHRDPVPGGFGRDIDRGQVDLGPEGDAVLAVQVHLEAQGLVPVEGDAHALERRRFRLRAAQQRRQAPEHLLGGIAGQGREGGIDIDDARQIAAPRPRLGHDHGIAGVQHDRLQVRDALLALLAREKIAHTGGQRRHRLGERVDIGRLLAEQERQRIAAAVALARHREKAAHAVLADHLHQPETPAVELCEIAQDDRAPVENGFGDEAGLARHGRFEEMLVQRRELVGLGREVARFDLQHAGARREPARKGEVGADMHGDELQAEAERGLEIGRGERRLVDLVGERQARLGQRARRLGLVEPEPHVAALDLGRGEPGEILEHTRRGRADLGPRLGIGHGQDAAPRAVARQHRRRGEEAHAPGRYLGIGGKSGDGRSIRHHDDAVRRERMGKERPVRGGAGGAFRRCAEADPCGRRGQKPGGDGGDRFEVRRGRGLPPRGRNFVHQSPIRDKFAGQPLAKA